MDGIFIQTDTSFNAKGDLTYETADGQENLSLTGNYKLNNVGDMKNHTFSVQLEVLHTSLFRNKRFMLDEMTQRNAS